MATYGQHNEPGLFLETTSVFDIQTIYQMDINSQQFKEFLVDLRKTMSKVSEAINLKDTGMYPQTEFSCGQTYFPDTTLTSTTPQKPTRRQVFRKTFPWPRTLPNSGIDNLAHGIDFTSNTYKMTRIYGAVTQLVPHKYVPIPYITANLVEIIQLYADGTNIYLTTNFNASAYNYTFVTLEYIKT